jgi:hypothetical protein
VPALVGVAALAALAAAAATRSGVGLSTDSVAYVDGARHLARGDGFVAGYAGDVGPITHWPPLYPALLAGAALLGVDPLAGARLLAAPLFAANVFVAGWMVWRRARGAALPALATAFLVLASADLLEVHGWAWSEPLFVLLCALGLHHLAAYLEGPRPGGGSRPRARLLAAGALVGAAAVTRYLGVTAIAAGGAALLWCAPGPRRRRVADAALFGALGAAPLALWMLRNRLAGGSATDRALAVNPIGAEQLLTAGRTVSAWLVPPVRPAGVRVLLLAAAAAALAAAAVRGRAAVRSALASPGGPLLRTLLCFAAAYAAAVALAATFVDADVAFDARILAPVHFVLLVALGLVLAGAPRVGRRAAAGLAAAALLQAAYAARRARVAGGGLGYAGPAWRDPALWRAVGRLPARAPLYSNAYDAVYIHAGRAARPLPGRFDPNSLAADGRYGDRLRALRAELARGGGAVVHVPLGGSRRYMPTQAELRRALAPFDRQEFAGGTVYRVRP